MTDATTDTVAGLPSRSATRHGAGHAGPTRGIDRRRLLPVGLLLAALGVVALLMLGLSNMITGGGAPAAHGTSAASVAPGAAASATATIASVILPSGSAVASTSPGASASPSASPSRPQATVAVPSLPDPSGNPLGYLQALSNQVSALIAQGPATLQPNAGQDLRNSIGGLQNAVGSAQQNGGKRQWRNVANSIAGVQQQVSNDASNGQISAPAASLLTGELQRLANHLPVNGD